MVTLLHFDVINQTLKRVDRFSPATDSVNYLKAVFDFKTDDWNDKTKYALFRLGTKTYAKALDSKNTCIVPFEVLKATDESKASIGAKNKVFVTLVGEKGTVRVPTNALRVDLETSGYADAENGADPTPDLYAQYIAEIEAAVAEHAANAANSMNIASEKAAEASESAASLKNDYSNALKGVASGAVVRVDDVSPVEHYPVVKVHGKNLIPYPYLRNSKTSNGGTFTVLTDGGIMGSGTPTGYCDMYLYEGEPLTKNGTITLALSGTYTNMAVALVIYDGTGNELITKNCTETPVKLNLNEFPAATKWLILIKRKTDNTIMSGTAYLQIEKGDTATEYTPYVDPSTVTVTAGGKTYTPKADGIVEGVSSIVLTDGITTDTDGMTVECEYNQDVNKVFKRLKNAIIALGGVV